VPRPLHFDRLWRLAGWGFVALVIWLSLTPDPPQQAHLLDIDVGHLAAYAWLMFWFAQLRADHASRRRTAVALVLLGVGLELLQGLTPYRTLSLGDMRDDAIGVAIGWGLACTSAGTMLSMVDAVLARLRLP
jgi:hypothetical protein